MATAVDTLALFERILALVKPQELHRSCNDVLHDEISALQKSVDDVVAIFAKVAEVREAVNQLEQGKASTGRSASLMEVMDNTMELQREVGEKLGQMATGMKVQADAEVQKKAEVQEKRKRRDEVKETESSSSDSSSSSEEEEDEEEPKEKKQKREKVEEDHKRVKSNGSVEANKMSADMHMAHECLNAITTVRTINKRIQFDIQDQWARAVFDIKRILKRQAECDARTTDNAVVEVAARALEAAAVVFKKLEWTEEHTKEVQGLTAALKSACSRNEMLRSYFHRVRAQLESVEMEIPLYLTKSTEDSGSLKTATAGSKNGSKSLEQQLGAYQELIVKISSLPKREKGKVVLDALSVVQQVIVDDSTCAHQGDIRRSIEHVRNWIGEVPLWKSLAEEYLRFANNVIGYSKRMNDKQNQVGWQSLATSLVTLLDEKRKLSIMKTLTPEETRDLNVKDWLASIRTQVEQWQDGIFSLGQVDKMLQTLNDVISYESERWNPLEDPTVCTCVEKLTICIQMIKKKAHRDKRLKTVKKWKSSIDKYQ